MRIKSFNALEEKLKQPNRWESLIGKRKPSADTLGYTLCRFYLDPLRDLVKHLNRKAWRNKAIFFRPGEIYRVVAIDGHELWASSARCCKDCLVREVEVKGKKRLDYYHRVVLAQWVGVTPPGILDLELIRPGEGEVVAARRLFDRILANYHRLFDVIVADAIYLEAPFIKKVLSSGKHVVIIMKQENRELYQDADQLRTLTEPQVIRDGSKTTTLWDLSDLSSFTTLGRLMRVVWCQEHEVKNKIIWGKKQQVVEENTWIWVTDLPASVVPATKIQRWGHDRWDLENRGFNELGQLWGMNHCFVHHPVAIEALLLTLAIAFLTTYLFYERNLKPDLRSRFTRLALANRLTDDLVFLCGAPLWPKLLDSS